MAVCPILPGFVFYPRVDSPGGNLGGTAFVGKTPHQLAALCQAGCKGFNTQGWLKAAIYPPATWKALPSAARCDGLYVRSATVYDGEFGRGDGTIRGMGRSSVYHALASCPAPCSAALRNHQ